MDHIETNDYIVKLLDFNNKEELREVQKLRYDYLLKDFDENKDDSNGLDDDGFDEFSDSILCIEKSTGKIVGTYRVSTIETMKGKKFKSEDEFDITSLRNDPDGIIETGRAVIHGDYRDGVVIGLLWKGLFTYTRDHNLRYIFGTCSLHGTDPKPFEKCTSFLNQFYVNDKFNVKATHNSFEYGTIKDLSMFEADIPGLLKAYLKIGARVSVNGFIDYEFNSCDVMIIMDAQNLNERYLKHFMG